MRLKWVIALATLCLPSRGVHAQSDRPRNRAFVLVAAGGGTGEIGPLGSLGARFHLGLSSSVHLTGEFARWVNPTAGDCFRPVDRYCDKSGAMGDVGINLQRNEDGTARAYLGLGLGGMDLGAWTPSANARIGLVSGRRTGVQIHLEIRSTRLFGKVNGTLGTGSVGIGLGF